MNVQIWQPGFEAHSSQHASALATCVVWPISPWKDVPFSRVAVLQVPSAAVWASTMASISSVHDAMRVDVAF